MTVNFGDDLPAAPAAPIGPMPKIDYPTPFLDKNWKAQEKRLNASATGLGECLRAMAKSSAKVSDVCAKVRKAAGDDYALHPRHAAVVQSAVREHMVDVTRTYKLAVKVAGKSGQNRPLSTFFEDFAEAMVTYQRVWKQFQPGSTNGLRHEVEGLNERLHSHRVTFNYR